ncbi:DUF3291 domain-containing protein [Muricauda sp. 2012CJ35-5]|uniref:DUF3291 domain-containing protein n=1 Tax=Flagellimonas spongiicola TaxID=2942208 RepID=A0ABT0PSL2_9FLAO|nr:DUF3291 domain-containing protein [Allomuricauda spongiicola]MCL6273727.1 DUF3291 domain-containing protein [Allomuricauda spongiicola]
MILVITSIHLRSPLLFFRLSMNSFRVLNQLKGTPCINYKSTGFWTKHYTMTLWRNKEDLKSFAHSGNHLLAISKSKSLAKEIRVATLKAGEFPNWKVAKSVLQTDAKVYKYA